MAERDSNSRYCNYSIQIRRISSTPAWLLSQDTCWHGETLSAARDRELGRGSLSAARDRELGRGSPSAAWDRELGRGSAR
jgi:hypothetical protein